MHGHQHLDSDQRWRDSWANRANWADGTDRASRADWRNGASGAYWTDWRNGTCRTSGGSGGACQILSN